MRFPGCQVLAIKFLSDKKRMFISLSCGIVLLMNTADMRVQKILFQHAFVIDKLKAVHAHLITAGIYPNVRIWNVDAEKVVDSVNTGAYAVTHLALLQEWLFIGTSDKALFKYNMKTKTRTPVRIFESAISCLKFTKK